MSIKYSLAKMQNPLDRQAPEKYYAKAQVREKVTLEEIAEEIAYATSLTEADVLSVLRALTRQTGRHLVSGDMVDLGDMGSFQFQLSSEGTENKEDFSADNIKRVRLQFRPGKLFRKIKKDLAFERVISVKSRKKARKEE